MTSSLFIVVRYKRRMGDGRTTAKQMQTLCALSELVHCVRLRGSAARARGSTAAADICIRGARIRESERKGAGCALAQPIIT